MAKQWAIGITAWALRSECQRYDSDQGVQSPYYEEAKIHFQQIHGWSWQRWESETVVRDNPTRHSLWGGTIRPSQVSLYSADAFLGRPRDGPLERYSVATLKARGGQSLYCRSLWTTVDATDRYR